MKFTWQREQFGLVLASAFSLWLLWHLLILTGIAALVVLVDVNLLVRWLTLQLSPHLELSSQAAQRLTEHLLKVQQLAPATATGLFVGVLLTYGLWVGLARPLHFGKGLGTRIHRLFLLASHDVLGRFVPWGLLLAAAFSLSPALLAGAVLLSLLIGMDELLQTTPRSHLDAPMVLLRSSAILATAGLLYFVPLIVFHEAPLLRLLSGWLALPFVCLMNAFLVCYSPDPILVDEPSPQIYKASKSSGGKPKQSRRTKQPRSSNKPAQPHQPGKEQLTLPIQER
ncbi:MAG: hypothetical protein ACFCU3_03315 [Verrucomicrobiales bacterium]